MKSKAMPLVLIIHVTVEGHKMLLVLVRQVHLGGKKMNQAVFHLVVNREVVEDKVMEVSQEINVVDMVNLCLVPVASLLVK